MEKMHERKNGDNHTEDLKKILGVEITENADYIIIGVAGKKRYVPKHQKEILVNGKGVETEKLIEALTFFPDDEPAEAIKKLDTIKKDLHS